MQELIARLGAIFSQLGEQVQAVSQNPDTGAGYIAAAIDVILPVACGILRVVAIPIAILIIVRCLMSLFREKTAKRSGLAYPGRRDQPTQPLGECHPAGEPGSMSAWIFPPSLAATPPCLTIREPETPTPANQKRHPAQRESHLQFTPGKPGTSLTWGGHGVLRHQ